MKAENQCGKMLKILIIDGGGDFNYREFKKLCEDNGIEHQVTTPYTSRHNGLAERRDKTLVDMTRSMLKEKNIPHTFYGEVVATAAYVLNRCPSKKLKELVPLEK